ncbi:MAG: PTS lactose/cellobiose transporter subunit IIA, partial [Enterococcus sp.]|nr:PTS lactose/cellobiose transporter subunit IIA [Enterococcus sp.]
LLTVHSQDHLMTSIDFTDLAKEIIDVYKKISA